MTVCMEPDWAVASKEQAVRDAQARADAEAARAAGVLIEATEPQAPRGRDDEDGEFDERD